MSWSRLTRRSFAAAALCAPLLLAGCSGFRPVYGEGGLGASDLAFAYAEPETRLEQIIIQDLALRLGLTGTVKPVTQHEAAVEATYTIVLDDEVLLSGTRRAIASYTTSDQVLADEAARKDALERAAHEVAETIRLSILGGLSTELREAAFRP
jgi:LPS-assembly lipoprotein